MFNMIKEWREQRVLDNSKYSQDDWQQAAQLVVILERLDFDELARLFEMATLFLDDK